MSQKKSSKTHYTTYTAYSPYPKRDVNFLTDQKLFTKKEEEESLELLIQLCTLQSESNKEEETQEYIKNWLTVAKITFTEDAKGNIYATKGKLVKDMSYPCFVSHMDTVHDTIAEREVIYIEKFKKLIAWGPDGQVGTGGDRHGCLPI